MSVSEYTYSTEARSCKVFIHISLQLNKLILYR